jgi:hypothetical protein
MLPQLPVRNRADADHPRRYAGDSVDSEVEIMKDPGAARLIVDTLDHVFGLKYAGAMP